jgi:hypothetical protein
LLQRSIPWDNVDDNDDDDRYRGRRLGAIFLAAVIRKQYFSHSTTNGTWRSSPARLPDKLAGPTFFSSNGKHIIVDLEKKRQNRFLLQETDAARTDIYVPTYIDTAADCRQFGLVTAKSSSDAALYLLLHAKQLRIGNNLCNFAARNSQPD